jgi:hypothetical protein
MEMRMQNLRIVPKALCLFGALFTLEACTPAAPPPGELSVAQAYETSGLFAVKPYTRTIFSSHNF